MKHKTFPLNGDFGIGIEGVTAADLADPAFQREAYDLWAAHGGLLAVRGDTLANLPPQALVDWANVFGDVERTEMTGRDDRTVPGFPILKIGNVKHPDGRPAAQMAIVPQLQSDADVQYNPETRRPVWHTDSTFRQHPPIGSVFQCRIAPPSGGETLFSDMRRAYANLDEDAKARLEPLEAICSLAHHDKKISLYSPTYPVLTPEQRAANPPNRVPVVLTHPVTGERALYGLNSSTCALVPKGEDISAELLDTCDLEGVEDESVMILRNLLPQITGPAYTVRWRWKAGDIVAWDNRCTIHAATGFDHERHEREMWRMTLLDRQQARAVA